MSRIIAIANQKGGVGKTTTAVNLGACLAVAERETLIVDMDPQGNATSGLGIERHDDLPSIYNVLVEDAPLASVLRRDVHFPFLDVAPSSRDLVGAEVELVERAERELLLRRALASLAADYEYVLVDCPPSLGLLTLNTLAAADTVLIPIQCEFYALEGLSQLLNTIRLVQRNLNPRLQIDGVLLTMFDQRLNLSRQVAEEAREYFGTRVYRTTIPRNVRLAEAPSFGKPIVLYDILSSGAQSYLALAREIIGRGGRARGRAGGEGKRKRAAAPRGAPPRAEAGTDGAEEADTGVETGAGPGVAAGRAAGDGGGSGEDAGDVGGASGVGGAVSGDGELPRAADVAADAGARTGEPAVSEPGSNGGGQ